MKKIVVRIKGGLGNQMFQYAAAREFQLNNPDYELVLDAYETIGNIERPLDLLNFNICSKTSVDYSGRFENYSRKNNSLLRVGMKLTPQIIYKICKNYGLYFWDESPVKSFDNKFEFIYLNGYWQSEKYFEKNRSLIKKEFTSRDNVLKIYNSITYQILNSNSVCLHIRLGDYLDKKNKLLYVCTPEYYKSAIKRIKKEFTDAHFFVFSNSIDIAHKMMCRMGIRENEFTMVRTNCAIHDFELMRICKHFIISNSTFSWWVQYLSEYKNKIVIAPSKWTKKDACRELYLDNWILEDCHD